MAKRVDPTLPGDPPVIERRTSALSGRYRIERSLGEGGMATVYLAEDLKHERRVAIKVLKPELAAADAVRITRAVAGALDYAHRNGVVHRDIKPENILMHDGNPVVADFGIALAVSAAAGARMTETGLSLGTPHYMSPEQASADRDVTARSDVYSLGCVLYEMLAGEPPHTGPSAQAIPVRILTDVPPPLTATLYLDAEGIDRAGWFGSGLPVVSPEGPAGREMA